ncbi:UNVERIFIED_CONTAM: hypothetical protein GTU68_036888 [Idotea baltica]|nr:hypothetical protein [Idotea baltica]
MPPKWLNFHNGDEESKYNTNSSSKPKNGGSNNPFSNPFFTKSNKKKKKRSLSLESSMDNGNKKIKLVNNLSISNGSKVNGFHNNHTSLIESSKFMTKKKGKSSQKSDHTINGSNHSYVNGHNGVAKKKSLNPNIQATSPNKSTIFKQRQSLPIFSSRDEVIAELKKHETTIIIGETGSGKTTQIPQFIHEERLEQKSAICITQPRRVAAITIAKRVAEEMNSEIGQIVGYSVRFEDCYSHKSKLKYVTDGMLLREALSDSLLSKYNWIILDEAHERSINTDILFGVVKEAQNKRKLIQRPSLHIIVMSATMDVDHFSSYFNDAPVIYIQGRQHPVEVFSAKKQNSDYTVACMSTMLKIHQEANSEEDILIFLTGQEEIDSAVKLISHIAKDSKLANCPTLKVYPLYAALPQHKQLKVFSPSLPGERKVILSTNIAETSVTIPGIKYVIDSGCAKVRTYNSTSGFDDLKVRKISQAQAWQRTGRAGREASGVCYRTYTNEEFQAMSPNTVPEILRANLSSVLLKLLAIGIKDALNFDFIDKPPKKNLKQAQSDLKDLKAIEFVDNKAVLSEMGRKMSLFPLEPQYAKLLINGTSYSCSEEILTLIAILSSESIYATPSEKRDEARERREKFKSAEGDHITFLNIYKAFSHSTNKKVWCRKNFLNFRNLSYAADVRRQLEELCVKNKIGLISCNENPEPVLRCLISVLYKNVAEVTFGAKYKVLHSTEFAKIHPSSTLFGRSPDYVLFTELVKTGKTFMHMNSEVRAEWLLDFDADYFRSKHIRKTSS